MQRVIFLIAITVLLVSCNQSTKENNSDSQLVAQEEVITASIEEMLAQPSNYEDKEVVVSGLVTHVCRHGGQKCLVLGEDGETQIRCF